MNRRADEQHEQAAALDELEAASGQPDSESAGQSGDTQDLPTDIDDADESVKELAENGQPWEAGVVAGVEDAGNHPERPCRSHEDRHPALPDELPDDPDWR